MINFSYSRAATQAAVVDALAKGSTHIIAGGTNLVDLMKRGVMTPEKIIDINQLPLKQIEQQVTGIRIGALALNSEVAENEVIVKNCLLLSQALKAGASPQLRNMATIGGNMMQRTRCTYFYDTAMPCNKRQPGSGCSALKGFNRMHAIFGASEHCIAVHPSDMCVALAALDALVMVAGPKGQRKIPFTAFHRLPGDQPQIDTNLEKGGMITYIDIPENHFGNHVHYLKVRDRSSFAFALVSVAAALHLQGNVIQEARLAMGGVAHKPWRATEAEKYLAGKPATVASFQQAAQVAMHGAKGYAFNKFKLKLTPDCIVQALKTAAGIA